MKITRLAMRRVKAELYLGVIMIKIPNYEETELIGQIWDSTKPLEGTDC